MLDTLRAGTHTLISAVNAAIEAGGAKVGLKVAPFKLRSSSTGSTPTAGVGTEGEVPTGEALMHVRARTSEALILFSRLLWGAWVGL